MAQVHCPSSLSKFIVQVHCSSSYKTFVYLSVDSYGGCPAGRDLVHGGCVWVSTDNVDYDTATGACDEEGGHLIVIQSEAKMIAVANYLQSQPQ